MGQDDAGGPFGVEGGGLGRCQIGRDQNAVAHQRLDRLAGERPKHLVAYGPDVRSPRRHVNVSHPAEVSAAAASAASVSTTRQRES